MKRKHLERASRLAVDLAFDLADRLPECCAVAPAALVPLMWPLGIRLERLERKAAKNRRGAKAYRKARREARRQMKTLLASQGGSAAVVSALLRSVPMDPAGWRVDLVPGMPAIEFEREAQRPEAEAA